MNQTQPMPNQTPPPAGQTPSGDSVGASPLGGATPAGQTPQAPVKKNNTGLIIGIIGGCLLLLLFGGGIFAAMTTTALHGARDKAKTAAIKGQMASLSTIAAVYFDENETYIGVEQDPQFKSVAESLPTNNTSLKVQQIDQNYFVVYAALPDTGDLVCVNAYGTTEITRDKVTLPNPCPKGEESVPYAPAPSSRSSIPPIPMTSPFHSSIPSTPLPSAR